MSKQEPFIEKTLTVPSELPFFHYNFNFEGLRKIVQTINIEVNTNRQQIQEVTQQTRKKLPTEQFINMQKSLNNSLILGNHCRKFIEESQLAAEKMFRKSNQDMTNIQNYCYKVQRLSDIVQYLLVRSDQQHEKLESDDKKYDNKITQAFRRLEDKLELQNTSFTKTINSYFTQTNKKIADLQSNHNGLKLSSENKFQQMSKQMGGKISEAKLKNQLIANENKIKKQLSSLLDGDHMKRLAALNQYSTKLKQTEKDIDIQQKFLKQKMEQMSTKLSKVLTINSFDTEKHKIFEKLSQFKNKIDDLYRRSQQFSDFRKQEMINNERIKQAIAGAIDDISKLNDKGSSFKKMESVTQVLAALDPHLICQIGNQVKLHEKEIGKLEKMFMLLQSEFKSNKGIGQNMPEINNGQNADMMTKLIKQYMSNMDFEGRVKKTQRDIQQLNKKNDLVYDLQKKVYLLGKEMDMGLIMKELKKKSDEESTNKEIHILDGKLEKLFQFYKKLRKQLEQYMRKNLRGSQKDIYENFSLTTKKLYSPNCLSCMPSPSPSTTRRQKQHYIKQRAECSLDQSALQSRNGGYLRPKKTT